MLGCASQLGLLLSVVVMPLSAAAVAGPAPGSSGVPADSRDAAIERLTKLGVLVGYPDGTARADAVMTRYEFAMAWARLVDKLGLKRGETLQDDVVTDVFEEHWAHDSVLALTEARLLPVLASHVADPMQWSLRLPDVRNAKAQRGPRYLLYRGDAPLLRGHFMEMAYRTFRVGKQQGLAAAVADALAQAPAPRFAVGTGVLVGFPDGQLKLYQPMVRGEFFVAAARATKLWPAAFSPPPPPPDPSAAPSEAAGTPGSAPLTP